MSSPVYIVQGWYPDRRTSFIHETFFTATDLAEVAKDIVDGQFGSCRIDEVLRYDRAAGCMDMVTADVVGAVIALCHASGAWFPETLIDAARSLSIREAEHLLRPCLEAAE